MESGEPSAGPDTRDQLTLSFSFRLLRGRSAGSNSTGVRDTRVTLEFD